MNKYLIILQTLISLFFTNAFASEIGDADLILSDFSVPSKEKIQQIWLIGEIVDTSFRVIHTNDEDLLGFLQKTGLIPKDDDIGRTADLDLVYSIVGKKGRIDITASNQLFSKIPEGYTDEDDTQDILEETSLSVVARLIHSEEKKTYFVVGLNYTNLREKPFVMTYLQDFLHEVGFGTPRTSLEDNRNEHFIRAIYGAGKTFEVLRNKAIAVTISTEFTTEMATTYDQSRLGFVTSGTIEFGGWRNSNDPVFILNAEGNAYTYMDHLEFWAKIELITRLKFKKDSRWYLEFSVFAAYYDTKLDNEYEGKPSYQTGITIRIKHGRERRDDDPFLF